MTCTPSTPVARHNVEIERNRAAWEERPLLREVYRGFYGRIAACLNRSLAGEVVELGSGIGRIKDVIPECVTTDLFPNPWLDRQESAYGLSFGEGSVSNLILFDVWHHLRYPGAALAEFMRVLTPGGRVILFEPAISWAGRLVYGLMHQEPVGMRAPLTWDAPPGFRAGDADYYACQSSATRIFWRRTEPARLQGWSVAQVIPISTFAYFATGGFSGPRLAGRRTFPRLQALDRFLDRFPRAFAGRLLVVLEKTAAAKP